MKKQNGVISMTMAIILVAVVALVGSAFYAQSSKISVINADLKVAKDALKIANDNLTQTTNDNANLKNTIEAMKALSQVTQEESKKATEERQIITEKVQVVTKKLPVVKPKKDEAPQSAARQAAAKQRITAIFEVYCIASPDDVRCTPKGVS